MAGQIMLVPARTNKADAVVEECPQLPKRTKHARVGQIILRQEFYSCLGAETQGRWQLTQ